jgi:hypothetical protein
VEAAKSIKNVAEGSPYMKLRLAGTVERLNVEHRTPNIDDATLDLF